MILMQVLGKRDCVLHGASRVGAHQIRHGILVHVKLPVYLFKFADKGVVYGDGRLSHPRQDIVGDMLRSGPKLSAHVILAQRPQERFVLIRHQVVKAKAGAHKHLLNPRQSPELLEELQVV